MKFNLKAKKGRSPQVVILSDVHIGADGHDAEGLEATLSWVKKHDAYLFLAGDLIDLGIPTPGDKSANDKILGNAESPTDQIEKCIDTFMPFAKAGKIIASVGGNHEHRLSKSAMVDLPRLFAHAWGVPNCPGAAPVLFSWKHGRDSHEALCVIGHGRSGGTANLYREHKAKLLGLYPEARLTSLGHTHHLEHITDYAMRIDEDGNEQWRKVTHVRSGNYLPRSGSEYSKVAMYAPLPQGSPILTFEDDVSVDCETLKRFTL